MAPRAASKRSWMISAQSGATNASTNVPMMSVKMSAMRPPTSGMSPATPSMSSMRAATSHVDECDHPRGQTRGDQVVNFVGGDADGDMHPRLDRVFDFDHVP